MMKISDALPRRKLSALMMKNPIIHHIIPPDGYARDMKKLSSVADCAIVDKLAARMKMPWYVGNREVHLKANIMPIHIPVDFDTPEDVMDFVTANGCNLVQGYYFSKPLPGEEFLRYIADFNGHGDAQAGTPER